MGKLVLIGSAPSSGSTMLADLLDSSLKTACGPELEFYCNKNLYDFHKFKDRPQSKSDLFALGSTGIFPNYSRLDHYGLNKSSLIRMMRKSSDLNDFNQMFCQHFLSFRSKDREGIVFEKTPQNVNAIGQWLQASQDNHFVFLVRDPLYVFNSLLNRSWGIYTSAATWLIYIAKAKRWLDHKRVHILKLEELVSRPYKIVSELINALSSEPLTSASEIENGYMNNTYRKESSRRKTSWEIKNHTWGIVDPNQKGIAETRKALFDSIINMQLDQSYCKRFDLEVISYREAMDIFGYYNSNNVRDDKPKPTIQPNLSEKGRFLVKSLRSLFEGNGSILDYWHYIRALEAKHR